MESENTSRNSYSILELKKLFLDANNYRFIDAEAYTKVASEDLLEPDIQR